MYKDKRILAIIPARGGSKGLPGKNIKPLCGKPLINWSIDTLKKVEIIDNIFVSTDCDNIADIAKRNGVDVPFLRNSTIAQDKSLVIDAVIEVCRYFESINDIYDIVLLIEPTTPLRSTETVIDCTKRLINSNNDSIATLSEIEVPFERIWKIKDNKLESTVGALTALQPRQLLTTVYKMNGVLYGIKIKTLLGMTKPSIITSDVIPYITDRATSVDIDTIEDFNYIEYIVKNGK